MSSGGPDRSQWKFDPDTGEPIRPDQQPDRASSPAGRAPITGPLGPAPDLPESVDAFRAPYQARDAARVPPVQPSAGWPEQAPYQPQPPMPPQGHSTPQSPTQPYGYAPQQPAPGYQPQYATTAQQVSRTEPPTRAGRAPLVLGLIAVLLLVGIAGGALYLWQNVFNRPAVSVERLLPANTLGYFSFDPVLEGQQKAAMDKIREAFEAQPGFKESWDRMTADSGSMLSGGDCGEIVEGTPQAGNLDTLATYLGNSVTIAVLAPDSTDLEKLSGAADSGDMSNVADEVFGKIVVAIIDLDFNPLNKKGPISDLKQQTQNLGQTELVEKYRDVEIRKFTPKSCDEQATDTREVYFALLDNSATAIVGTQAEPLRVLVDGLRDNKTLKDDATFKALSGQVPQERIAALYFNLTEIYRQVQLAAPEMLEGQSVQNVSGAMLLTLSAANDGLQIDSASETDLSLMDTSVQVNPDLRPDQATLDDVPSDALAFYVGTDLKTTLETLLKNLRSSGDIGGEIDAQIKSLEDAAGINVEQDLIPLLGGDYAISVSLDKGDGNISPSVVFQLKLSDADKMKSLLDKAMSANPDSTAEKVDLAGGNFYADPFGGAMLGVAHDRFWFIFDVDRPSAEARLQSTIDNLGKGFGTSTEWNNAKTHLARDSNAIAYANLTSLREYLETTFVDTLVEDRSDYDNNVAPFLRPLKYILVGSATQAARNGQLSRNHTVMFLGISK